MLVWDFVDMCTQDDVEIELWNCGTNEDTVVNINDLRNDPDLDHFLRADMESWDINNGRICINYSE